jgi:hypothetical protein
MPDWVSQRPQTSMYYIGVGSANKTGLSPNAYTQNAKNAALNDLSSDISVNISSSSVMSTLETDYNLSENYQRTIKASSNKSLEGYEVVDTWDGGDYYWVYIRMSKMAYKEQKARKKQAAIKRAKEKFMQAKDLKQNGDVYQAIHMNVDAISDLSEYLAENTNTTIEGETVDLGTAIYRSLVQTINSIEINAKENPVKITSGKNIPAEKMTLHVSNSTGKLLPNLPFRLNFTGSGLLENKLVSDQNGKLHIPLNKIYSNNQLEKLTAELDMLSLSRLTKDIFIRTLIKKIPPPTYSLQIQVMSPTVFVESRENELGRRSESEILYNAMLHAMAKNNMRLSNLAEKADFIIRIEGDTEKAVTNSYQKTALLNYTITVMDEDKRILYRKNENKVEGYGTNYEEASKNAYQEGVNLILRKNFDDIKRSVFSQ